MIPFSDRLDGLGTRCAQQVARLWEAVEAGHLPASMFDDLATVLVRLGNEQAQLMALAEFTQSVTAQIGAVPEAAPAVPHAVNEERLRRGLGTITTGAAEDIGARLLRYARAEVLEAAQRQLSDAIRRHPRVKGWRRVLEADACQLCVWWGRDGRVWPADHMMPTHKGCACHPEPVITADPIKGVSRSASDASADRRGAGGWQQTRLAHEGAYSHRSTRGNP